MYSESLTLIPQMWTMSLGLTFSIMWAAPSGSYQHWGAVTRFTSSPSSLAKTFEDGIYMADTALVLGVTTSATWSAIRKSTNK